MLEISLLRKWEKENGSWVLSTLTTWMNLEGVGPSPCFLWQVNKDTCLCIVCRQVPHSQGRAEWLRQKPGGLAKPKTVTVRSFSEKVCQLLMEAFERMQYCWGNPIQGCQTPSKLRGKANFCLGPKCLEVKAGLIPDPLIPCPSQFRNTVKIPPRRRALKQQQRGASAFSGKQHRGEADCSCRAQAHREGLTLPLSSNCSWTSTKTALKSMVTGDSDGVWEFTERFNANKNRLGIHTNWRLIAQRSISCPSCWVIPADAENFSPPGLSHRVFFNLDEILLLLPIAVYNTMNVLGTGCYGGKYWFEHT